MTSAFTESNLLFVNCFRHRRFDKDGALLVLFKAFTDPWDIGGVEVALGDVNGDLWPDIIAGEGPAHFARTTVASGDFRDGVRVGAGDKNGDGRDEVYMCTGPSTVYTHYEIFEYNPTAPNLRGLIMNEGLGWVTGKNTYNGCRVAGGDLDRDGKDELLALFEGPSNALLIRNQYGGKHVRWNALGGGYTGQISIAAADVNGDKRAEVFLGRLTGLDKVPPVFMYDGAKVMASSVLPTPAITYPITNSIYNTGIYVAAHDLSLDGISRADGEAVDDGWVLDVRRAEGADVHVAVDEHLRAAGHAAERWPDRLIGPG
jgi:hypothetical protein